MKIYLSFLLAFSIAILGGMGDASEQSVQYENGNNFDFKKDPSPLMDFPNTDREARVQYIHRQLSRTMGLEHIPQQIFQTARAKK